MVLRSIADNGKVLQSNMLVGVEMLDIEKGVNNSGTFHYICNDCDSKYFRDYENPDDLKSRPSDMGMISPLTFVTGYRTVGIEEIPNFLDRSFAIN